MANKTTVANLRNRDVELSQKEHSYWTYKLYKYVNIVVHSLDGKPLAIFPNIKLESAFKLMTEMAVNGIDGYAPDQFVMIVGAMKHKTAEDIRAINEDGIKI